MNQIFLVVGGYLLLGGVVLAIFDSCTGRIRSRLAPAADETRTRMVNTGSYTGHRTALFLIVCALWLFWPALIVGALSGKKDGKEKS